MTLEPRHCIWALLDGDLYPNITRSHTRHLGWKSHIRANHHPIFLSNILVIIMILDGYLYHFVSQNTPIKLAHLSVVLIFFCSPRAVNIGRKRLRFNWWQARRLNQNSKKSFFWFHSVLMCFVMSIRVCLNIYGKPMERPRIWWLNMAFFILRSRLDSFPKCGWILPETSSELVILCPKLCFLAIWVWKWWSENGVYTSHNNRDNYDWPVDLGFSP